MNQLRITQIQRHCVYNGPGVRTTVFLKGCVLKCPWCCNPETINPAQQYYIDNKKCLILKGKNSILCQNCERLGGTVPMSECMYGVYTPVSQLYTTESLVEELQKDKDLYIESAGGVTFSGGEPLLQYEGLAPVLEALNANKISVYFETTLNIPERNLSSLIKGIDGVIVDLKLQPEMKLSDKQYLNRLMNNLALLETYHKYIQYRLVFVDSILDYKEEVLMVLKKLTVNNLELLKCHNLGCSKYDKLGLDCHDYTANADYLKIFSEYLSINQIQNTVLSI